MSKPIQITSISQLLDHVEREKTTEESAGNTADFIFRGQPLDRPLLPRLARIVTKGRFLNTESLILREFERTSVPVADFQPATAWDRVALAQHHGLPTRLLDWTYSALASLWFALPQARPSDDISLKEGVIWLLKTRVEDFIDETTRETPFDNGTTRLYRPKLITRRIAAQAGLFTVHKVMPGETLVALEKNRHFKNRLIKFIIPPRSFSLLKKQLNGCGVNHFSLFPDLDGLCKYLEWRYFH